MLKIARGLALCGLSLGLVACGSTSVEQRFFDEYASRSEREAILERYPIDDQYKIFVYGNQQIHPPHTDLARVLARRGKQAVEYVLDQVDGSKNDLDYRDSLLVFEFMQNDGYYPVCTDARVMGVLAENERAISDMAWRAHYHDKLARVCE